MQGVFLFGLLTANPDINIEEPKFVVNEKTIPK